MRTDRMKRMFTLEVDRSRSKSQLYSDLAASLESLLAGEKDPLANLANASALLAQALDNINWCGFYLLRGEDLVLGPFQGKPACVRIPLGKGVCGKAALSRQTLLVPDVTAFPDHIACDAASRSEIVVPILEGQTLRGVLDIDSPQLARFDEEDRKGLERFVQTVAHRVDWKEL